MTQAAIVGFGQIAQTAHAPAYIEKNVRVAAVAEPSTERQAAAARIFPEARLYSDLPALLAAEKSLDFIDIATQPYLHAEQARTALERDVPVLCEKPLTLSSAELAALCAARQGKILWTVHNWAYAPQWTMIQKIIAEGALGPTRRVDIELRRTAPAKAASAANSWRTNPEKSGGGILVDHGWHNLYLIYRTLGVKALEPAPEIRVETMSGPLGAEDEIVLTLFFSQGRQARLSLSWKAHERANFARVELERGNLELRDDILEISGARQETIRFTDKLSQSSTHPVWFAAMLDDFLAARAKPELAQANFAEARFCGQTIAAVYASGKQSLAA